MTPRESRRGSDPCWVPLAQLNEAHANLAAAQNAAGGSTGVQVAGIHTDCSLLQAAAKLGAMKPSMLPADPGVSAQGALPGLLGRS